MDRAEIRSLRPGRRDFSRLVAALLISLLLHAGVWGGYKYGEKHGWWQRLHLPSWVKKLEKKKPTTLVAKHQSEPPLIFVDVSRVDVEPPKQTKYYSAKNSQAANRAPEKIATQPKVDGRQQAVPKTETTPPPEKLQPAPAPAPAAKPKEEEHPHDPTSLGDLKLSKPVEQPEKTPEPPKPEEKPRPRTLKQAQQQLAGEQMKQDGGVKRTMDWSSLDVKSTAFGEYDRAIVQAVTQRWYDLLESHRFSDDRTGKVTVRFKLLPDGSIIEVSLAENNVGQMLGYVCAESVQEVAPFAKWPDDMRRAINANFREISFTFYYY